jgi:septal ring factor EnvC (AmiA/AmiB activator)
MEMDDFRELFCFKSENVVSYELNSSNVKSVNLNSLLTCQSLQNDIIKMQEMLLLHKESMDSMENTFQKINYEANETKSEMKNLEKHIKVLTDQLKAQQKVINDQTQKIKELIESNSNKKRKLNEK